MGEPRAKGKWDGHWLSAGTTVRVAALGVVVLLTPWVYHRPVSPDRIVGVVAVGCALGVAVRLADKHQDRLRARLGPGLVDPSRSFTIFLLFVFVAEVLALALLLAIKPWKH
jgi:hypothetical protein